MSSNIDNMSFSKMHLSEKLKLFCLYLKPGVGPSGFFKLIQYFKSADGVFGASFDLIHQICPNIPKKVVNRILEGPDYDKAENQLSYCRKYGVNLVSFLDKDYPAPLSEISNPPPFLFIKGGLPAIPFLGVVGTRHPSEYGVGITKYMVQSLIAEGIAIISGMAKGIDAVAHWHALQSGGFTAAVLGSGLDTVYPKENAALFHKLGECGALVTEYPFGTPPEVKNFPLRNRIISGMTLGTLVVEAGSRSGALITARYAKQQGKFLFAIPGSLFNRKSDGCHGLIRRGANLVRHPIDICRQLKPGLFPSNSRTQHYKAQAAVKARLNPPTLKVAGSQPIPLSGLEAQLFNLLETSSRSLDELCALSGSAMHSAITILLNLEARGLIERRPGSMYCRANTVRC